MSCCPTALCPQNYSLMTSTELSPADSGITDSTLWQQSRTGRKAKDTMDGVRDVAVCADEKASRVAEVKTDRDPGAVWRAGCNQRSIGVDGFESNGPNLIVERCRTGRMPVSASQTQSVHLTLRQSIAGLARRTWSQNVMASELEIHPSWYQASYHFYRGHQSIRIEYTFTNQAGALVQRYRKRTPAMVAGWTRHRWSVSELIMYPLPHAMG